MNQSTDLVTVDQRNYDRLCQQAELAKLLLEKLNTVFRLAELGNLYSGQPDYGAVRRVAALADVVLDEPRCGKPKRRNRRP